MHAAAGRRLRAGRRPVRRRKAGATLVVKSGGAQAVGALAFGTRSVPRVDRIVGPGNAYVTEAKRQVSGLVGIDGLAGPSEVTVVAGPDADPLLCAVDLVAQAEHDPDSITHSSRRRRS